MLNCGEFICTEDELCAIHIIEDLRKLLREVNDEVKRLRNRPDYLRRETFGDGVWHDAPPLIYLEE